MAARPLLGSLLLFSSIAQEAGAQERAGDVTVLARGPGGLRIEGRSTEVSLAEEASASLQGAFAHFKKVWGPNYGYAGVGR